MRASQFASDFTMAKTRRILFLITIIVSYIGSTNGGFYSEQNTQNQSSESLNSQIGNVASEEKQSDFSTTQSLNENLSNEDNNINTRYELDHTVPQNINEEQYRSVINQLESEVHKPENYYSNQERALPNLIQSANTPSSVIQQTNPGSANLLPNEHNGVQNVKSNQIILQSESFRTTHLRSFYPSIYRNYANDGTILTQPNINPLPLSTSQPHISVHQIQDNTYAQKVLPYANVESLPDQRNNLLTLPIRVPPALAIGQIPVSTNVKNVLPQSNIGLLPTQSINVQPPPLSSVQPLVQANEIPVNYNAHHILPHANVGVIPAQLSPDLSLPLSAPQVLFSEKHIPLNSGVHVLPQESVGILPEQPNLLPVAISQQGLVNGHQIKDNFNDNNSPPFVNVPAGGQFILNGASDYSNIGIQNSLPVNVQQAPIAPIVTKDIYFHVAPPDFEDVSAPTSPPKKTYKIIFIKLPSQEHKNTALLQSFYNQYAARQDKTLIYVLVKKPEEQQVKVLQPKAPSEHEVIFVKYKNAKENSATVGTNEAEPKHDDSLGLINGH